MPYNADTSLRLACVCNNRTGNVLDTAAALICVHQHFSVHHWRRAAAELCQAQLWVCLLLLLLLLLCNAADHQTPFVRVLLWWHLVGHLTMSCMYLCTSRAWNELAKQPSFCLTTVIIISAAFPLPDCHCFCFCCHFIALLAAKLSDGNAVLCFLQSAIHTTASA